MAKAETFTVVRYDLGGDAYISLSRSFQLGRERSLAVTTNLLDGMDKLRPFAAAVNGLLTLLLAAVGAGLDPTHPSLQQGLLEAIEALGNEYDQDAARVITVVMEGGVIQDILGRPPGTTIRVCDYTADKDDDPEDYETDEHGNCYYLTEWRDEDERADS